MAVLKYSTSVCVLWCVKEVYAFSFSSFKVLRDYISSFSVLFWERSFVTSALKWYLRN